jgi:hypothetical protein
MQAARCWLAVLLHENAADDRAKLIRDDSLLYRELQGVCTLCPTRQKCSLDLANGGFDAAKWKEMVAVLTEFGNAENDWRAAKLRKNVPIHSRDGV